MTTIIAIIAATFALLYVIAKLILWVTATHYGGE